MHSFVNYLEKTGTRKDQRKFIEEVAHNTPDIIYVLDLAERKIIFINDRVLPILGYDAEEVYKLGSSFFVKKLHPEDYLRRMQHIIDCQNMQEDEVRSIDVRLRVNDGSWRWFRIRDIAYKFSNGKAIQTIGVARDIDELKLVEEEVHKKDTLLRAAINLIPDLFQVFKAVRDAKNQIVDLEWVMLNDAAAGYTPQAIGKQMTKQYPGVIPSGLFAICKQVVETGQSCTTEIAYDYDAIRRTDKVFVAKIDDGVLVLSSDLARKKPDDSKP